MVSNITSITPRFKGVLLDAYGVFWGGNEVGLFPGAKELMEQLVSSGTIVGVLSNSTQPSDKELLKYQRHGLIQGQHFHFFVTSGDVTRSVFLEEKLSFDTPRKTFWLFGGIHPRFPNHQAVFENTAFRETSDLDEADFIYISIPHIEGLDQENPEVFARALEALAPKQLPMVCANPDAFAHEGNPPRAVVRQGTIAKMYEALGGQVFYIGKPYQLAYEQVMQHFQTFGITDAADILMVGDTLETDIRGARSFGMSSALVTQTGIMSDRVHQHGLESALTNLPAPDQPDFLISQFK